MYFLTRRLNHLIDFVILLFSTALSLTFIPVATPLYPQFPVYTTSCNSPTRTVQAAEFVDNMRFDILTIRKRPAPACIPTSLTGLAVGAPAIGNRPENRFDHHPANRFISSALLVPLRI